MSDVGPAFEEFVRKHRETTVRAIASSAFVTSLMPRGEPDVKFALELGISILFDKPILLVAATGSELPPKLLAVADEIVYCDVDTQDGRDAITAGGGAHGRRDSGRIARAAVVRGGPMSDENGRRRKMRVTPRMLVAPADVVTYVSSAVVNGRKWVILSAETVHGSFGFTLDTEHAQELSRMLLEVATGLAIPGRE